ncbi:amino acid-binding protein [Arcobacter sp. CECT 8983]|uniref:ABC transporter substrate-binding protein n=1 Tax=Arcobacter sp. CECT 8983 TaxID=2044508 RepID=UPI00100B5B66|nr:ABC transporter substrate-binding protein [Arcobacter sp. CECT 8983]RXJ90770.1 amino acid-binding protein [Arcobacter sp. CECT 8983]
MIKYISVFILIFILSYYKLNKNEFNEDTLYLGTSLPKTGIMKAVGHNVYVGANAYFNYANEMKLLPNNKKIKLLWYDDKYEPELTKENLAKLVDNNRIFALFGFVGTPTVKNIIPELTKLEIPFIAPFSGASFLRNKQLDNFINFRSSYQEEIDKIVNYLYEKKGIDKFAVFYQNDTFGEEGYVSLIKSLKKKNLDIQGEGMYKRNTLSIRHAFLEIKSHNPQAIIMIGAYEANAHFIKKAKEDESFKDTIFCNISFGDANEMVNELNNSTSNILFSQVVPPYYDNRIRIVAEYRNIMKKYFPKEPLGFVSLESFLAAKTTVEAIKRINGDITQAKFLKAIKTIPNNVLKGIKIEYKNHQLLNNVYLFKYKNHTFEEIKYD